ncbi:carbohydrate ABC transporter permease [Streptomyces sp. NPDC050509]|uniref:carbohydrate ABC transporter permease n=1 Tax=Streptomyces sp. NPDC050509 TaxID=3365620 RepID=UPI0037B79929
MTTAHALRTAGRAPVHGRESRAWRLGRPVLVVLLAAVAVGVPLWLVLVTSAKPQGEAVRPNLDPPRHWQPADNYADAVSQGEMLRGFVNSLLVVVPSVALVLILGAGAAWVFARRSSRLVSAAYALTISGLLLPPAVITIVMELRQLGLAGTRPGMIAVYTGMYLSTSIFFMTGFVRTIPYELEEAARIDGAKPLRIFLSLILPLLRPVIATATIMVMLYAWSDIFYAFFVLGGSDAATLPINLYQVAGAQLYLNNWHLVFAYVVVMSLPMVAIFLVAQRRIVSGITSGAVK